MMGEISWTTDDAAELYQVEGWGNGFFDINKAGNMVAIPDGEHQVDLKQLCDELAEKDLYPPFLLRFSDILKQRMGQIHDRFSI
ncbi:MAG: arginine decarboxylase, partial [Mariprofundus sp.]|nr:arginine decarboxylase [Mariprofundus sp.]